MKLCRTCNKKLTDSSFYRDARTKDGLYSSCKNCHQSSYNKTSKTVLSFAVKNNPDEKTVASYHFYSMIGRLGKEGVYENVRCLYSKKEFETFVQSNWAEYMKLHKVWKKAGFTRKFSPTVDRIDSSKDYSLDNIRFMPFGENCRRGNKGRIQTKEHVANRSKGIIRTYELRRINKPTPTPITSNG